ncbi:hypothetical protein D3C85_728520 [compost metagenome]
MAGALAVRVELLATQIEQRRAVVGVAADVFALAQQRAVPQVGAEHQRVFQALGGVDGDDLHPLGIALQAQQGFFAVGLGAALGVEPAQQLFQPGALQALALQQFGQVQQVGQAALAIDQGEQPRRHLLLVQPGAEGAHKALLLPELMVALGGFALGIPGLGVVLAGGQIGGAAPEQTAGQGITQCAFAARFGVGGQHRGQLAGLLAVPDVFLAAAHAGHAARRQLGGDFPGLAVAGDQHGDIAALECRALALRLEISLTTSARRQQRGDAPGRVAGHQGAGLAFAEVIVGQPDQCQRRVLFGIDNRQHQLRPRPLAGADLRIGQALFGEGHGPVEQTVERSDQLRRGTMVGGQAVLACGFVAGLEVGGQVRAPEGVDGLLGIADETQVALVFVDPPEHLVLHRIGVLELVDQRHRVLLAQGAGQVVAALAVERLLQFVEQVVEGQQALGRLALRQLLVELADQAYLQVDQALLGFRLRGLQGLAQALQGVGQRAIRRALAFLAGLGQAFARQPLVRLGLAEQRGGVAEVAVQLGLPGAEFGRVAHIALEAGERLELLQPAHAVALPGIPRLLPGVAQGAHLAAGTGLRLDAQIGLAQVIAQTLAQALRGELVVHQKGRPLRLGSGQLVAPEVGEQGVEDFAVVVGQFVVEVAAGLECRILQCALAEAVDGEDRRLVETVHRQQQTAMTGRIPVLRVQPIEQLVRAWAIVVDRQQLGQAQANAFAQLGGGRGGEGHHQNLADVEPLLQQQPGVQGGEGPGLAGAGTGLDQRATGEAVLQQVQRCAGHASSSSLPCRASRAGP